MRNSSLPMRRRVIAGNLRPPLMMASRSCRATIPRMSSPLGKGAWTPTKSNFIRRCHRSTQSRWFTKNLIDLWRNLTIRTSRWGPRWKTLFLRKARYVRRLRMSEQTEAGGVSGRAYSLGSRGAATRRRIHCAWPRGASHVWPTRMARTSSLGSSTKSTRWWSKMRKTNGMKMKKMMTWPSISGQGTQWCRWRTSLCSGRSLRTNQM